MYLNECLICHNKIAQGVVCPQCDSLLHQYYYDNVFSRCPRCNNVLVFEKEECEFCKVFPKFNIKILSAYFGFLRQTVESYKFDKIIDLSKVLAYLINEELKGQKCIIVPIPSSKLGIKKRGFDQMKTISSYLEHPVVDALVRVQDLEQKNQTKAQRLEHMGSLFALDAKQMIKMQKIKEELSKKENKENKRIENNKDNKNITNINQDVQIVVIDDIFTTGTTMISALKLLGPQSRGLCLMGGSAHSGI